MDNYYCKLFESRGCLLLIGKGKTNYDQLNVYVYEIRNGRPEWTFKYFVNYWRISSYGAWSCIQGVSCIALGESEEDSFMVIILDGKVVLYKFVLKTPHELPELLSILPKKRNYNDGFLFTASFASV
nr:hypothetical protein [Tanacetum cinerariifolium]